MPIAPSNGTFPTPRTSYLVYLKSTTVGSWKAAATLNEPRSDKPKGIDTPLSEFHHL